MHCIVPLLALALAGPACGTELHILGQEYPPFNWSVDGQFQGGMIDVLRAACDKLRYRCQFTSVPLARAMKMLELGEADAVMSLIPNAERAVYAHFSPAIVVDRLAYFTPAGGTARARSLGDLKGWTIGAVRGSNSLQRARENQQLLDQVVVEEVNNETLVRKLQAGRYGAQGAIIGGEAVLRFEAHKIQLELEAAVPLNDQNFMTAFSRRSVDAVTMEALTKTLVAMKKSGEMRTLLGKYGLKAAP